MITVTTNHRLHEKYYGLFNFDTWSYINDVPVFKYVLIDRPYN